MKAYIMGNYTAKAFQGFLKDPASDRKAVVKQLTEAGWNYAQYGYRKRVL